MRQGPELVRASNAYAKEDRPRTWRLLAITILVWATFNTLAIALPWWPAQLAAAVLTGLTTVRMFIFYHDHMHGAVLHDSKLGKAVMWLVGTYTLNPAAVWKETHDYHHKNNAKILGASIGSFPVLTTTMWREITPSQRFWYAFARHPLIMATGYFTIFAIGMCITPFRRDPKRHYQGPLALVLHIAGLVALTLTLGWQAAFFGLMLPLIVACGAGAYLFYAQHNFPDIELKDRKSWDYSHAALKSSSMFDMSAPMHWFTGNIGYHHVHHLNHRIPFYRLPEAMAEMPELQNPGRTSWHPRDIYACLQLKLWDPEQGRMIGWPEEQPPARQAAAS